MTDGGPQEPERSPKRKFPRILIVIFIPVVLIAIFFVYSVKYGSLQSIFAETDVFGGRPTRPEYTGPDYIAFIRYTPDGNFIETYGPGKKLRYYETGSFKEVISPGGDGGEIYRIYNSKNMKYAAWMQPYQIRIMNMVTSREIGLRYTGSPDVDDAGVNVHDLVITPDGTKLIVATGYMAGGGIEVWDSTTGDRLGNMEGGTWWDDCFTIDISIDGTRLLGGLTNGEAGLWDVDSLALIQRFSGETEAIRLIRFSHDENHAVTMSEFGTLRSWDLSTGQELMKYNPHEGLNSTFGLTSDGKYLVAGYNDGKIFILDFETGEELVEIDIEGSFDLWSRNVISPDGTSACSSDENEELIFTDLTPYLDHLSQ